MKESEPDLSRGPEDPRCDFCNAVKPEWRYGAPPMELPVTVVLRKDGSHHIIRQTVSGDWCACDECAKLVDARDVHGMLARVFNRFNDKGFRSVLIPAWHGVYTDLFEIIGKKEIYKFHPGDGELTEVNGPGVPPVRGAEKN
jgi:hypothetical protein